MAVEEKVGIEITGGADDYQAAAIVAVIQHVESETAAVRRPGNPNARHSASHGGQGDLFARVAVETPVNLSAEQKEILQQFDESIRAGGEKHSPRAGGWRLSAQLSAPCGSTRA